MIVLPRVPKPVDLCKYDYFSNVTRNLSTLGASLRSGVHRTMTPSAATCGAACVHAVGRRPVNACLCASKPQAYSSISLCAWESPLLCMYRWQYIIFLYLKPVFGLICYLDVVERAIVGERKWSDPWAPKDVLVSIHRQSLRFLVDVVRRLIYHTHT